MRATDRLTQQGALHKVRIKDLVRQIMPMTPLDGEIGAADLVVLERYADPNALVKAGAGRITPLIAKASRGHLGAERAEEWLEAARAAIDLYAGHEAVVFSGLAAEVRLLRACQRELAAHQPVRQAAYMAVDPDELARSLRGVAEVGGPGLVAVMGDPARFRGAPSFRSFTGLAPKASETGETDRKGQPMSRAGSSLLRTTLVRPADNGSQAGSAARPDLLHADGRAGQGPSAPSASWRPTWPSGPGWSWHAARPTSCGTSTAQR